MRLIRRHTPARIKRSLMRAFIFIQLLTTTKPSPSCGTVAVLAKPPARSGQPGDLRSRAVQFPLWSCRCDWGIREWGFHLFLSGMQRTTIERERDHGDNKDKSRNWHALKFSMYQHGLVRKIWIKCIKMKKRKVRSTC